MAIGQKINLPEEIIANNQTWEVEALISAEKNLRLNQHEVEGQLLLDVAETETELVVVAAAAGVRPENLEMHLHNDLLTIRGERFSPVPSGADYFCQESYWGKFSRTVVLPSDVQSEQVRAEFKNGLLIIRLPKKRADSKIPLYVIED